MLSCILLLRTRCAVYPRFTFLRTDKAIIFEYRRLKKLADGVNVVKEVATNQYTTKELKCLRPR